MPTNHARKKDIREQMAVSGQCYREAAATLEAPDPGDEVLCETCGWTVGMICPECPGCGCYNGRCSGWRHEEYMDEDEAAELRELERCEECGADTSMGSYDECLCG